MMLSMMVARVMRSMKGIAPGTYGYNDIVDMFNEGQRELSVISSKIAVAEIEVDAGDNAVDMPVDILSLSGVRWTSQSTSRMLTPTKDYLPNDHNETVSEPYRYYTHNRQILIRPTPGVDGVLSIEYIPVPPPLEDDEDTPYLEGSEDFLIANALFKMHLEMGTPMMQIWEQERRKHMGHYVATTDQNYATPFEGDLIW